VLIIFISSECRNRNSVPYFTRKTQNYTNFPKHDSPTHSEKGSPSGMTLVSVVNSRTEPPGTGNESCKGNF